MTPPKSENFNPNTENMNTTNRPTELPAAPGCGLMPAEHALSEIILLSAGWDADGSTGPRPPLSWESVGRMALDYAMAAMRGIKHALPKISALSPDALTDVNPGIRETVQWLRLNGFQTCDSGDGKTHDHDCDLNVPYVHLVVEPERLVSEARRLESLLNAQGVEVGPMNEEGTAPTIECGYNPANLNATISLFNVVIDSHNVKMQTTPESKPK